MLRDGAALEALAQSRRRFLAFLERRVGSRADAEDVLQAAFLRAVARSETLRDETRLIPWFYRVLRRALADHHRRRAARVRLGERVAARAGAGADRDEDLLEAACACLSDVLPALRPEYVEVIRRVDLAERPVHRAARELGIAPGAARVRLHRARRALLRALRDVCRVCADHGCLDCTCQGPAPDPRGVTPRAVARLPGRR